jgi:pyruvate carboxylase
MATSGGYFGVLRDTTKQLPCGHSVVPTRYFLGRPDVGEELHISIEKGKTLIIRLMAVGPVVEGRAQRDVWFEVNGEASECRQANDSHADDINRYER